MKVGRIFRVLALLACAIVDLACAAECPTAGSDVGHVLVAKNAPPWDTLRIWERAPATSVAAAEAEVARIGGSRLLLEVDRDDVRTQLLNTLRIDTIRVLRGERMLWAKPPVRRDNAIEVQLRSADDAARALKLLVDKLAFTIDSPSAPGVEFSDMGNGFVRVAPTEAGVNELIGINQRGAMRILESRVNWVGLSNASVRPAGFGRIRAIVPGLADPQRLGDNLRSQARLEIRLVDTSIDLCDALNGRHLLYSEILFRQEGKAPVLVEQRPLAENWDFADAAVALAPPGDRPIVVFRLNSRSAARFIRTAQANVGGSLAIVLDSTVIALARIAEPLTGAVELSDGLDLAQAEQLAMILDSAIPPARLVTVEQQVVAAPSAVAK
jgi:preprotein translocase subunit SecD